MTTQPLGPPCQSIPEHRSYTSSPGIVLGWLPNPLDLSGRVSQNAGVTPAVPGLSQDGYPTTLSERQSYTSSPGIVLGWLPNPWDLSGRVSLNTGVTRTGSPGIILGRLPNPWDPPVRVSLNTGVTPAVLGLSWDGYPTPWTSLAEYPRTPELHRQSRDCPGIANQPLCQNARVTPAVLGLSWDGYPTPGTSLAEYPRTPELHRQSRDCPRMTTQPLCQSIPEHLSCTSSPGIVLG